MLILASGNGKLSSRQTRKQAQAFGQLHLVTSCHQCYREAGCKLDHLQAKNCCTAHVQVSDHSAIFSRVLYQLKKACKLSLPAFIERLHPEYFTLQSKKQPENSPSFSQELLFYRRKHRRCRIWVEPSHLVCVQRCSSHAAFITSFGGHSESCQPVWFK